MDHSLNDGSSVNNQTFNGEAFVEDLRAELQEIDAGIENIDLAISLTM